MNWALAIERNRDALLRVVAALFAMAGLVEGATVAILPRHLRNQVLRILRPAESAARRLIVIAARGIEVTLRPAGDGRCSPSRTVILGLARGQVEPRRCERTRSVKAQTAAKMEYLSLLDPLPAFSLRPLRKRPKDFPRITCIGLSEPTPIPDDWIPSPEDEVDATRLGLRLAALKRALDDLDKYAKRFARWRARRDLGLNRTKRFFPLRPGRPPGHRKRPVHEVDDVLRECHSLAVYAQREDTS